jgi:hypothetical protein
MGTKVYNAVDQAVQSLRMKSTLRDLFIHLEDLEGIDTSGMQIGLHVWDKGKLVYTTYIGS